MVVPWPPSTFSVLECAQMVGVASGMSLMPTSGLIVRMIVTVESQPSKVTRWRVMVLDSV